jgi:hypothetical protein
MWADEPALDEATRRLDDWGVLIASRAARAKELSSQVQAMRGTATSPDRTIQVTVDSSGLLVDLHSTNAADNTPRRTPPGRSWRPPGPLTPIS